MQLWSRSEFYIIGNINIKLFIKIKTKYDYS